MQANKSSASLYYRVTDRRQCAYAKLSYLLDEGESVTSGRAISIVVRVGAQFYEVPRLPTC